MPVVLRFSCPANRYEPTRIRPRRAALRHLPGKQGIQLYTSTLTSKFLERCRYFGKFLGIFAFLRHMQPIVVACSANLYVGERLRYYPLNERICGGFDIVGLLWWERARHNT